MFRVLFYVSLPLHVGLTVGISVGASGGNGLSPGKVTLVAFMAQYGERLVARRACSSPNRCCSCRVGAVVLLGGLVGLYAKQSEAAGRLGFVGFLVAFLGTALPWGISATVGMCAC